MFYNLKLKATIDVGPNHPVYGIEHTVHHSICLMWGRDVA